MQFHRYEDATSELPSLTAFDSETLEDLRERQQSLEHLDDRIGELKADLEAARTDADRFCAELRESRERGRLRAPMPLPVPVTVRGTAGELLESGNQMSLPDPSRHSAGRIPSW